MATDQIASSRLEPQPRLLKARLPRRWRAAVGSLLAIAAAIGVLHEPLEVQAARSRFNKVLSAGDAAPEWSDLPGVDEKKHSLADYKDAAVVVVVFTCNHCPVAKMYEERLLSLAKDYGDRKVQVVAINVNRNRADRLDKMKIRAAEKRYTFPYLYDESQKSARAYGATVTPHFFVLDKDRHIAYMGGFDDSFDAEKVTKHYVIDAVESLLAGEAPRVRESLQRGCAIEYEQVDEPDADR